MNMNRADWLDRLKQKWAIFCLRGKPWRCVSLLLGARIIDALWAFWFTGGLLLVCLVSVGLDEIYMKSIRELGAKAPRGRDWGWKVREKAMTALERSIDILAWLSLGWLSSRLVGAVGIALGEIDEHSCELSAEELDAWVWCMGFNPLLAWRLGVVEMASPWWMGASDVDFTKAPGRLARWAPRRCGFGAGMQWEAKPIEKACEKMQERSWVGGEQARQWLLMGEAHEERRVLEQSAAGKLIQEEKRSKSRSL